MDEKEYWVYNGKKVPWWRGIFCFWGGPHIGRFWKRRLSKIRRRAWKDPHQRGLANVESRVNMKDW